MITFKQWTSGVVATWLDRDMVGVMAFLRRRCPILPLQGQAMVFRDADVRAVLASRRSFAVPYGEKMRKMAGAFALGIDDTKEYAPARAILDRAVNAKDVEAIRARTAELAEQRVADALDKGWIDVVGELADPVLAEVTSGHLGLRVPDAAEFVASTRAVFREIFLNDLDITSVRTRAEKAGTALRAEAARAVQRSSPGDRTAVERLLAARANDPTLTDDVIAGNVAALAVAWIPNTTKSVTLAIDELLRRPAALAMAQQAARGDDDEALEACLFEALRFRPQNAGVIRMCVQDHELGIGHPWARVIKPRTAVVALTKSAMMDDTAVDQPHEFRTDRPPGDSLHFGYGRHTCLGEPVARAQLPALAKPILRLGRIERAKCGLGRVRWDGPYPRSLRLKLYT